MRTEKKELTNGLDKFVERLEDYKVSHEELLEFTLYLITRLKTHKIL